MSILNHLSSQTGDRSEYSNRKAAIQCLDNPDLLEQIASGLKETDTALQGDCAEVLTKVAEDHPQLILPYGVELARLIQHKNTRVRWEAMHALALISRLSPALIASLLPRLAEVLHSDASVIVRDHATDAVAVYASTSANAAQAAFPILKDMLSLWNGKQAGHALQGLVNVARLLPSTRPEIRAIAEDYAHFPRAVVHNAAKALLKELNK